MLMGLVVLIIWLLSITEHHCVNTPNSKQFVYALFTQLHKKAATKFVTASFLKWTS